MSSRSSSTLSDTTSSPPPLSSLPSRIRSLVLKAQRWLETSKTANPLVLIDYNAEYLFFSIPSLSFAAFSISLDIPHSIIVTDDNPILEELVNDNVQFCFSDDQSPSLVDVILFAQQWINKLNQDNQIDQQINNNDDNNHLDTKIIMEEEKEVKRNVSDITSQEDDNDNEDELKIVDNDIENIVKEWNDEWDEENDDDYDEIDGWGTSSTNDDGWGDAEEYDPVTSSIEYRKELTSDEPTSGYSIIHINELRNKQEAVIQRITNVFNITAAAAVLLLRHEHWNELSVIHRFRVESQIFAKEAGCATQLYHSIVTPAESIAEEEISSGWLNPSFECPICYDDVSLDLTFCLLCLHRACLSCYKAYVANSIETGTATGASCLSTRCVHPKCKEIINHCAMELLCEDDDDRDRSRRDGYGYVDNNNSNRNLPSLWDKYQRFWERSFVDDNQFACWCPRPNCQYFILRNQSTNTTATHFSSSSSSSTSSSPSSLIRPSSSSATRIRRKGVQCLCGYRFCFLCANEDHAPSLCQDALDWISRDKGSQSLDTKYLMNETKPCPTCGVRTRKEGGCLMVQCTQCQTSYCWHCGENHHVWECNKPAYSNVVKDLELNLYLFYYERYFNHHQSLLFSSDQLKKTQQKMEELVNDGMHFKRASFLYQATELVIECRRVLKWTYVHSFYVGARYRAQRKSIGMNIHNNSHEPDISSAQTLFEHRQSDLEKYTEQLNALTEGSIEKLQKDRDKVLNWTEALKGFLRGMQEDDTEERVKPHYQHQHNNNNNNDSKQMTHQQQQQQQQQQEQQQQFIPILDIGNNNKRHREKKTKQNRRKAAAGRTKRNEQKMDQVVADHNEENDGGQMKDVDDAGDRGYDVVNDADDDDRLDELTTVQLIEMQAFPNET